MKRETRIGDELSDVKIVPFEWYHVLAMELREQDRRVVESVPDYVERAKYQAQLGPSFTAIVEGQGVACSYGFAQQWPGVVECWMLTSPIVERHKFRMIRAGRKIMDDAAIILKAHRLQITINSQFTYAIRYAEALYFEPEGVLKAYGADGSDWIMYARTEHGRSIRRQTRQQRPGGDAAEAARHAEGTAGQAGRADA